MFQKLVLNFETFGNYKPYPGETLGDGVDARGVGGL